MNKSLVGGDSLLNTLDELEGIYLLADEVEITKKLLRCLSCSCSDGLEKKSQRCSRSPSVKVHISVAPQLPSLGKQEQVDLCCGRSPRPEQTLFFPVNYSGLDELQEPWWDCGPSCLLPLPQTHHSPPPCIPNSSWGEMCFRKQ